MQSQVQCHTVRTGADRLLTDSRGLIENKRVGILTNHTGRLSNGEHLVDAVVQSGLADVTALFGPEHGIMGDTPDGEVVDNAKHPQYGIPMYSLYGKIHKPTKEMLSGVDLLICDIQDIGARFYTYISTIALALEGAAEQGVSVLILDRPNPIRGIDFDGPIREQSLRSFVGWMPIPVMHGMTIGELARMWNDEHQLEKEVHADLTVVPMEGWARSMWYDETSIPWISPSPNMQRLSTAAIYPGLCFIEGTSISEGRGTPSPFELIGAPWAEPKEIIQVLEQFSIPGVTFSEEDFIPKEIPGTASEPKYEGERCRGIRLTVKDRDIVQPVRLGIQVISAFKKVHPEKTELRNRRFDILTGKSDVRKSIDAHADPQKIFDSWESERHAFGSVREKYLLYT
ncbi:MAG: DUF1343 domain-containing protein [Bacteroidota bacterium]